MVEPNMPERNSVMRRFSSTGLRPAAGYSPNSQKPTGKTASNGQRRRNALGSASGWITGQMPAAMAPAIATARRSDKTSSARVANGEGRGLTTEEARLLGLATTPAVVFDDTLTCGTPKPTDGTMCTPASNGPL